MAEPAIAVATAGGTRTLICGSGPPLVLVHGVGMSAAFWRPQLFALAPHRMVVAYDMLGHGEAPLPPVKPSLDDYADQLQGVLNGLGLGRVALVGHSMGALVVLHHALAHPERVERVVAMNAVYCRSPEQLAAVQARAADLESGRTAEGRRQTLARWFGDPAPPALGPVAAWVDAALAGVDFVGYARTYRLFASSDAAHRGRLGGLAMPALFLTGTLDANSTPAMSAAMASEVPDGRVVSLAGERHMMSLASPGAVDPVLAGFLDGSAGPVSPADR